MMKMYRLYLGICLLILSVAGNGFAQVKPVAKPTKNIVGRSESSQKIIDSLELKIAQLEAGSIQLDSLFKIEKLTSADLRDQVIRIDDYRKKLEANINSFKGENLKLNQSNRILIVFNSLVAVLLLVTLFYFLKRIGKKKNAPASDTTNEAGQPSSGAINFGTFEDKLQHLERLGALKEKGLLSEAEFLLEKQRVLGK
ncbi:MAG: hypothetical protein KBH11_13275 [Bacteroidia bacterium]|nr:hypothetical protein [Bacteroidota bacterium]MBP9084046.1 hypothetical protein [Bacteroidia bacterium]MBK7388090.1 hypothetical protein [Bacteroidota bacterium]MBK7968979.1 hypothetical protein [Bacteroidota bacterium]MBK8876855.1 hypothetical protein [Bacteroidota bacterium]